MMTQLASKALSPSPTVATTARLHATHLGAWMEIGDRCVLNHVDVGDYSYIERDCDVMNSHIGKFTSIAASVRINPSNHPWWRPTLHHFTYRPGKFGFSDTTQDVDDSVFTWRTEDSVIIGHDVWIGHGAIVLPGVAVGNGAIIGAGSVVTKNVSPYTVVVGNPARVLRPRFEDISVAERLEALSWWDWPHDMLKRRLPLFQGGVTGFLAEAEQTNRS